MQDFKLVLKDFSHQRTATYTNFLKNELEYKQCTKKQVYDFYVWSGLVNSVFWQCIERIEIILRNRINDILIDKVHHDWLNLDNTNTTKIYFKKYHEDCIKGTIEILNRKNKQVTNGRLVSELTMGFWVSFSDIGFSHSRTEKENQHISWKDFIPKIFPNYPTNAGLSRFWGNEDNVKKLINVLRFIQNLRNRIAHHEHIFKQQFIEQDRQIDQSQREYWLDNLKQNYCLLIDVLGWMSSQQSQLYKQNYFHQYACYLISLDGFNNHISNNDNNVTSLEKLIEYLMTILDDNNNLSTL